MPSDGNKKILGLSPREIRGVLLLLPLIAVLAWIVYQVSRPDFDDSAMLLGDTISTKTAGSKDTIPVTDDTVTLITLHAFDPNSVTYEELRGMGFTKNTAAGIVKYRERGKVFEIPEDFATCYGVTDSMYAELKPFIKISKGFSTVNTHVNEKVSVHAATKEVVHSQPLTPFDPNVLTAEEFTALGFSPKQSQAIINFRESRGGFLTAADFGESYVVSDEMFTRLKNYIIIEDKHEVTAQVKPPQKLEVNGADSAALTAVRGIGPVSAAAIIDYRTRLGGFHDVRQLAEIPVITEKNHMLFSEQIWVDSCVIQKIDINFATPNSVSEHPYMPGKALRKILKNRQLKGGWSTIEDMIEDNTLTSEEAHKLAPYLQFTAQSKE